MTGIDNRVNAGEVTEGQTTALLESYSAQLPSGFYLGAALASVMASLVLKATKRDQEAVFVGQWVAPFLLLGIYNKMVKQHGSDAATRSAV